MQCVRVGYGVIARIHERKFRELGVGTAAVVDIDAGRRAQAAQEDHIVRASCAAALDLQVDFWDVCVDSGAHLAVMREIVALDPHARILLEKPICQHREIAELRAVLAEFQGRLTVNENYSSSNVTSMVRTTAFDTLRLTARRVVVEMSKSRIGDFEAGRFVDYEAGALRYEGPHMLAILDDLGPDWAPTRIERVECDDALVELPCGFVPLFGQGVADVTCEARCGVPVGLFTSMSGTVKFAYPPYGMRAIARDDRRTRYRIVAVDGVDPDGRGCSVVGFFEPVAGLPRGQGAVAVIREGRVDELVEPLPDDNMRTHLARTIRYFAGDGENPCSADDGVRAVGWLHEMFQCRLRRMQAAVEQRRPAHGLSIAELMTIDDDLLGHVLQWMVRRPGAIVGVADVAAHMGQAAAVVTPLLDEMEAKGLVARIAGGGPPRYRLRLAASGRRELPDEIWDAIGGDEAR